MNKAIVIIGASAFEKRRKTKELLTPYKADEIVVLQWNENLFIGDFLSFNAHANTKAVVIEGIDVLVTDDIISLIAANEIRIHQQYMPVQTINKPQFIFVSKRQDMLITNLTQSVIRRIELIKL